MTDKPPFDAEKLAGTIGLTAQSGFAGKALASYGLGEVVLVRPSILATRIAKALQSAHDAGAESMRKRAAAYLRELADALRPQVGDARANSYQHSADAIAAFPLTPNPDPKPPMDGKNDAG